LYSQTLFDAAFKDVAPPTEIPKGKEAKGAVQPVAGVTALMTSTIMNYFVQLSREITGAVPFEALAVEAKLLRVKSYMQKYCLDNERPVLFADVPEILAFGEIKPNLVCVQSHLLRHNLDQRQRSDDDVDPMIPLNYELQPRVVMMFLLAPVTDEGGESPQVGGKQDTKAPKGPAKGAVQESTVRRIVPLLCAVSVEQYLLTAAHASAVRLKELLYAQQTRKEELDAWRAEQAANGVRPSTAKSGKSEEGPSDEVSPADVDTTKGDVINGVIHLIRRGRHGSVVSDTPIPEKEKESMMPRFSLTLHHATILCALLDGSSGCMVEDADVVQWIHSVLSNA
jgi:hypothetical protein